MIQVLLTASSAENADAGTERTVPTKLGIKDVFVYLKTQLQRELQEAAGCLSLLTRCLLYCSKSRHLEILLSDSFDGSER
jgi:hypothetical protein